MMTTIFELFFYPVVNVDDIPLLVYTIRGGSTVQQTSAFLHLAENAHTT